MQRTRTSLAARRGTGCARATRPGLILSLLLLPLAMNACAVGPDYVGASVAVPAKWSAGDKNTVAKPDLARWWMQLNDPLLNSLIDEAVAGNLDVATAKARVREARANYRQTLETLYPTLRGTGAATRQRSAAGRSGEASGPLTTSQFQAGFDAGWEIDFFGKNERGAEAARHAVEAADEQLRLSLLTLIGDVASNYVQARGYQARITLAQRTAATQRQTAKLTRTRFEAGAVSEVDLANATGQTTTTEAAIPSLEISYAETVHRLSVLTGRAPGDLIDRMKRGGPVPRPKLPMPAGIPADILVSRPDVRMAERRLAETTARIGQAEAARYPTVSLTGNITTSGARLGDLARNSSIGWSFGPGVSVPIFNGGQLRAAVEVAKAQRDQNFVAYRAVVLRSLEEVENGLVVIAQERLRYRKLAAAVGAYRQAAALSRSRYESGSADFLTVLDAERSLYAAEDALVQSRIALATGYIALNKALGGGWDGIVDASKPAIVDVDMGPRLAARRR